VKSSLPPTVTYPPYSKVKGDFLIGYNIDNDEIVEKLNFYKKKKF
jgi:hypothetical protein